MTSELDAREAFPSLEKLEAALRDTTNLNFHGKYASGELVSRASACDIKRFQIGSAKSTGRGIRRGQCDSSVNAAIWTDPNQTSAPR
jgi:hypothetical protein